MSNLNKTFFAFFVESCLFIATGMVAVGILIFSFWKAGLLGTSQADLVIFGFQFACAGGIYMAVVPVIRYMANMVVRMYHFPVLFVGLCIATYTSIQMHTHLPHEVLKMAFYMLVIPPVSVILMVMLKTRNAGLPAPHQTH